MAPAAEPTRPPIPTPTPRRSLSRAGVLLAVCLAFGAVVNFGVAWGCVRRFERKQRASNVSLNSSQRLISFSPDTVVTLPGKWTVEVPSDWPDPKLVMGYDYGYFYMTDEYDAASDDDEYVWAQASRMEVGWPLRCWWGTQWYMERGPNSKISSARRGYVDVPPVLTPLIKVKCLPIGIHPLPFIVNTLLYAAIPVVLWLAIRPLRPWRRRRAGRCTHCGYDRAGLPADSVCPECGHAVPHSGHTAPAASPARS